MSAFEGLQRRLTQLYSDTKQSCDVVTKEEKVANIPELLALHLEFRIQRERLSAWGLEWSDDNAASEGSIDEAVARAGVTDTVTEVLQNIQIVLEEAERIRQSGSGSGRRVFGGEKTVLRREDEVVRWSIEDRARYETLAKDLKDSIDLLYDLSTTRRELRQGTYPSSGKGKQDLQSSPTTQLSLPPIKAIFTTSSYAASDDTLVNPTRVSTSKTFASLELPSRLDPSLLELPEEEPPPYDRIGATVSSRMIAYLKQPNFPSSSTIDEESVVRIPVLVEFAPFDPAYRVTGVQICTDRLDQLLSFYARSSIAFDDPAGGNLSCLGFFEDAKNPRFGLVYELPKALSITPSPNYSTRAITPTSLLKLLQASSRTVTGTSKNLPQGPPLEDRFRMAYNIVHAFSRMHTDEHFTHKNVNSSNIIFFPQSANISHDTYSETVPNSRLPYDVRTPYLSSFDLFSEHNLEKLPPIPARNIYRNEDDPLISENECSACSSKPCTCSPYRYDIHGLAMVLVEIGLWIPISDIYKSKYSLTDLKKRVEQIWLKRLRVKCGSVFTDVVRNMLVESSADINEENQQEQYNLWLNKLRRCCLIDEAEDNWFMNSLAVQQQTQAWSRTVTPKASNSSLPRQGTSRTAVASRVPYPIYESGEEDGVLGRFSSKADLRSETDGSSLYKANSRYESAAEIIQRAWRSKQDKTPFRIYRQKVATIQRLWRKRKNVHINEPSTTSATQRIISDGIVLESQVIRSGASHTVVHIHRNAVASPRPKLRIHNIKLQPELLDAWHHEYQPRLERIVDRALRHSPESASIELHMIGETATIARPTVFINCTSTSRVKGAINRKWQFDPNVLDIKVRKAKITRSKAAKSRPNNPPHRSMMNERSGEQMPLNPFHQQRPLCGASIGAFVGKHLPPVSFGGIVDIDGELFGMTVHHLLDDPSEDEAEEDIYEEEPTVGALRSSGRRSNAGQLEDFLGGFGGAPSLQTFPSDAMFPFEISDDEDDHYISDEEDAGSDDEDTGYSSEDEEMAAVTSSSGTLGDINGIVAGSRDDILVTQPALDDVSEDFFPCLEDRDEDHLDSHTLGHVYASSGIKRWNRKGIVHEIDWALLKLEENRVQPCNLIQGGKRYYRPNAEDRSLVSRLQEPITRGSSYFEEQDEFPTQIAKADELGNLPVHCFGRTSGLAGGVIGPVMSSVRIYKRRSFARSWYVMGDFGGMLLSVLCLFISLLTSELVGGDSGAWVIDNDQGRVCGHVLAWCSRNKIAYICPAEVLLDDMKRTLGATRVCLPGSAEEKLQFTAARCIEATTTHANVSIADGIPDISKLGLGENGGLIRSRLNGSSISPRMEIQRLFGSEIAR